MVVMSFFFSLKIGGQTREHSSNRRFTVDYVRGTFLKDGQPFNYVSGKSVNVLYIIWVLYIS